MVKHLLLLPLISLLFSMTCGRRGQPPPLVGYDIMHPDKRFILPDTLHEISGLTELDSARFACIQDEAGILFIVNVLKNEIESQINFAGPGDYEAIARVGRTIYVLRSDGVIFEVQHPLRGQLKVVTHFTYIPAHNNEGLCYDEAHNRLLVACKSKAGKGAEYKDRRAIYAFDLHTKQASKDPVYEVHVDKIIEFALNNHILLPTKTKGKNVVPVLKFSTSEIALHPITGELYLLSATDHMLFIFDRDGAIKHIEMLDQELFNKPEGVSFMKNGDMLITNEGQNKHPTLLRFNYRPQQTIPE